MSGGQLRLEGRASASRTITVDGVAMGTSDGSGGFRIERAFTPPADCTVDVNDGSATPATPRLTGCTITAPPAATPASLALSPTSVTGGTPSTGTVTLTSAAPSGGRSVTLASNSGLASVPSSVTVSAGATSTTFTVTTTAPTQTSSATVTATAGGVSRSAVLTVTAGASAATLTSLTINPNTVVELSTSTGTLTLSAAAPAGGVLVTLMSSNTAATVPPNVTVPAGSSSATFAVTAGSTSSTSSSIITASAGGVSRTAGITVTTESPTLSNLFVGPLSVTGGTSATGTVTLTAPAPANGSGVTVSLSSDNPSIASVPASVTVDPGNELGSFTVSTSPVNTSQSTVIRATHGTASRAFTFSVTPAATGPAVVSVTVSQATVVGGTPVTGTVRLASAAPAGGQTVFLSSDIAAVIVPATVTVPAGAITATFAVETRPVTNDQSALIIAEAGGGRVGAVLTVRTAFSANNGSISLARGGNGEGRVTSSPPGIDCTLTRTGSTGTCGNVFFPAGTNIRLDARPLAGSQFQGWDFEVSCRDAPNVTIAAAVAHICRPVFRLR